MKIQERVERIGEKVFVSHKSLREKITEWVWFFVSQNEACPYFYLPVYRSVMRNGFYVMPIPIALVAVFVIALYFGVLHAYRDSVRMVSEWAILERIHKTRDRFFNNSNL